MLNITNVVGQFLLDHQLFDYLGQLLFNFFSTYFSKPDITSKMRLKSGSQLIQHSYAGDNGMRLTLLTHDFIDKFSKKGIEILEVRFDFDLELTPSFVHRVFPLWFDVVFKIKQPINPNEMIILKLFSQGVYFGESINF